MNGAFILIGIIAGNFIYQGMGEQDYGIAFERSFFQAILYIMLLVTDHLR